MHDPTFWILARASGLTAYFLLTLSVLAGLVLKSRPFGRALSAGAVTDTHRFLATLGLGAVALHGMTLVLDSTIQISPTALLVPGLAPYRPLWTAFGVGPGRRRIAFSSAWPCWARSRRWLRSGRCVCG